MPHPNRRDFLRHGLLGLAALPLGLGVLSRQAFAQQLPPLDPTSDPARALSYVENAADAADNPAYADGETCANCLFFQPDSQGCQLFPQNSVAPGGWCQSWTAGA